jgi:hypothetical protein
MVFGIDIAMVTRFVDSDDVGIVIMAGFLLAAEFTFVAKAITDITSNLLAVFTLGMNMIFLRAIKTASRS